MEPQPTAIAVWASGGKSLVSGTPATPTTTAQLTAKAIWEYAFRTLTTGKAVYKIQVPEGLFF